MILARLSRSAMVRFSGAVAKTSNINLTSFYFTQSNDSLASVSLLNSSSISELLSIIDFSNSKLIMINLTGSK